MGKFASTQAIQGLVNDIEAAKTAGDIVEFVLNGQYDGSEGSKGSLHSESGMEKQLESSYLLNGTLYRHVGNVDLTPNRKVLFLANDNGKEALAYFVQGKVTLIREFKKPQELMGFSTKYPIAGIGRIRRGTDEVIYWNDGKNPDRYIILTKLESYLDDTGCFNPDLTLFNQKFKPAQAELVRGFDTGGTFEVGGYRLGLQYGDALGNFTETFYIGNPFFAVRGAWVGTDNQIRGGFNVLSDNNALRSDAYDVVNKSFEWKFTNIDTAYETLRIFVVKYTDGNGTPVAVYQVRDIVINDRIEIDWTFQGVEGSTTQITIEELTASYARYSVSQAMHHIQNILIKANLTETPYDWAKFQKYALSAKVKWVSGDINIDDDTSSVTIQADNKHAVGGWRNHSAYRGDVQTIGFSVLMNDGTKSPALMIPGRPCLEYGDTYTVNGITYDPITYYSGSFVDKGQRNAVAVGASWDKAILEVTGDETLDGYIFGGLVYNGFSIDPTTQVTYSNAAGNNGTIIGEEVPRWRVYNTAIDDIPANVETGYIGSGIMGYYEVDTKYPEVRDSDGDIVFPHTVEPGGAITMHQIRHHQFPDCDLSPIHSLDISEYDSPFLTTPAGHHIHPMGVKIFDLEFPPEYAADVAGVQFYWGDRTEDFIISDKGFLLSSPAYLKNGELTRDLAGGSFAYNPGGGPNQGSFNQNRAQFQSPAVQFDKNSWSGASYLRVERMYVDAKLSNAGSQSSPFKSKGFREYHNYASLTTPTTDHPFGIKMLQYLNRAILTFDFEPFGFNPHYLPVLGVITDTQKELGINLFAGIPGDNPLNAGLSQGLIDSFEIGQMEWVTGNGINTLPAVMGHLFNTWTYASLRSSKDVFDALAAIIYQPATGAFVTPDAVYDVQGRDCFIVRNFFIGQFYNQSNDDTSAWMHEYFSESSLNADLRHEGQETANFEDFFPLNPNIEDAIGYGARGVPDGKRAEEFNALSLDFAVLEHPKPSALFDLTIDYQSQELGRFPVRVAWSGKSQDEELTDLNLVFGALDYDDLSTDRGEIRMLAQKPNALYAMTDFSVFLKPTNAQQLDLSLSTAFLKQSNFLDIAETELYDTGSGYGGCQHRLAHIHTEFGTFYVNQFKGEVYLLNKQVVPLTNKGLKHRLNQILPSKFLDVFMNVMDYQYPLYDASTSRDGLGIRVFYDPLWKRAIISKIDYEFKAPFEGEYIPATALPNVLYWQSSAEKFVYNNNSYTLTDSNPTARTLWQRRHITLSYDFEEQKWASYHSWSPRTGFNDTTRMYTQPIFSEFWYKHVKHNYLEYYDEGIRFPFIVEWNVSNLEKTVISNLSWLTRCGEWDSNKNRYLNQKEETFNQLIMYTDYHTTGLLDLINLQNNPFAQFNLARNEKYIKRHNHVWRVNQLWDMRHVNADTEPAMTEDLDNALYADTWYQGLTGGYIDKEVNIASYDLNKSLFTIPSIDNEFVTTRLIYHNQNLNHRLSVDLMSLFKQEDLL